MLFVEIADTPSKLAHGLMFKKEMPQNEGMLFQFSSSQHYSFWGQNTYIPLDVAFVNKDNEITEIKQITPLSTKMVSSNFYCNKAIEANAGYFSEKGIKPGDKIEITKINNKVAIKFVNK